MLLYVRFERQEETVLKELKKKYVENTGSF